MNIDLNDIIFFIGFGTFVYGLWLFNPAVSLIATGVILMFLGWFRVGGDNE